jgi:hypothetical protein
MKGVQNMRLALLVVLIIMLAGCRIEKEDHEETPPVPARVSIFTDPDTLWLAQGDTATANVIVFVCHECCTPLPGRMVHTFLTEPHHGWLTPLHPEQGDTTDAYGQIHFSYFTSIEGVDTIIAGCENAADTVEITARLRP